MPVHKLGSGHSKNTRTARHSPDTTASSHAPAMPVQPVQRDSDAPGILQLQGVIGNHATLQRLSAARGGRQPAPMITIGDSIQRELEAAPIAIHHTSPHIQRTPLSDKEAELAAAVEAQPSTQGSARRNINKKITKLKAEIEVLKTAPTPVVTPPVPKTAAEEFPSLKPTFSDTEITELRDQLSADKLKLVIAVFTPGQLKSAVTKLTLSKFKELVDVFTVQEVMDFGTSLGPDILKSVLVKFSTADFKNNVTTLTLPKFKDLLAAFTIDQVWDFGAQFTLEKLKQLVTVWPVAEFKLIFGSLGIDIFKDLMGQFTGVELKTFITVVGPARFQLLVKTKKIKATGLKKYGAAWLKTFVGAGATTMNHLLTIYTKSDGVISGGHDAAVFYPELDRIIGTATYEDEYGDEYDEDVTNGRVTSSQVKTNYDKVIYATHNDDGSTRNTGAKSLIHNLSSQQALWLKRANEAIWASIAAETFDRGLGSWAGTSEDGIAFNGFYHDPALQVATFFPVN